MEQQTILPPNAVIVRRRNQSHEEIVSIREFFDFFLLRWPWFILSVVLCTIVMFGYLKTKSNIYQRQAVILVKEKAKGRGNMTTDALMQLNGVMMDSEVKNEMYILQSFPLAQEVVRMLHLDVVYNYRHNYRTQSLYDERPFTADFADNFSEPFSFKVNILSAKQYEISDVRMKERPELKDFTCKAAFGELVTTPFATVTLRALPENMADYVGESITVTRLSVDAASASLVRQVKASMVDKECTLIALTCTDTHINRADDILAGILEAYKQSIIDDKNLVARSTYEFIEERIKLIGEELSSVEGKLADYKTATGLVDMKATSTAFVSQSTTAADRTMQAEIELGVAKFLSQSLTQANSDALVPSLGAISDAGIQRQIEAYNELMIQRNRLRELGDNNTTVQDLTNTLAQKHQALLTSVDGYIRSLEIRLSKVTDVERELKSNITGVPQKERMMLDIARQQAIKETLYTFLLNRREETALQLAITETNIRVVETPHGTPVPVSPRRSVLMLLALFVGAMLPFAYYYIKRISNTTVQSKKDVESNTSIPVIGEIPRLRKTVAQTNNIVVSANEEDSVGEAFRLLRFNIGFINRDARVIMLTSTIPGEGKSFISRNLAYTLSLAGKRVVLVDTDIRRRTQSRLLTKGKSNVGLTSFLSGAEDNVLNLVVKDDSQQGMDFLPAGITPPNPAELLMSNRLEECIEQLKQAYDYVVVDNVPAQMVADAGIVNRVADMTLYIMHVGKVDRRYLSQLDAMYKEKKFKAMSIVLNGIHHSKSYSYGYGYGSYGGYHNKS